MGTAVTLDGSKHAPEARANGRKCPVRPSLLESEAGRAEFLARLSAGTARKQQTHKSCRRAVHLHRQWHAELHNQVLSYSGARSFYAPTIMAFLSRV